MPANSFLEEQTFHHGGLRRWYIVAYILFALMLVVRLSWYPVIVSDYIYFIRVWFDEMQTHAGLTALAFPFADYAPLYLYLLKIVSVFPVSSLFSAKTLSFFFDVGIAFFGYRILKETSSWRMRRDILFLAAAVLLSLPTIMMNSSLWSQSDSIYTAGVVASLFFMLIEAPFAAAAAFGFAISTKIQAIFFAPVLIGYLLRARTTWKYLAVPPALFFLSVVPAWVAGGPFWYWLFIYVTEVEKYPYLSVSAQSIFAFVQPFALSVAATNIFFWSGITLAALVAFLVVYLMRQAQKLLPQSIVMISLASVLLIPYLLPRMHERYFYMADVLSTLYAFFRPSRWFVPVFVVGTSLMSYMPFLSPQVSFLSWAHVDLRLPAALLVVPLVIVLVDVWRVWQADYARP